MGDKMIISPVWDNLEKTALYIRLEGFWTWDEFNQNQALAEAMLDDIDHPVTIIVHIVDGKAARPPKNAFDHWSKTMDDKNAHKVRNVLLVSDNLMVGFFVTMSQRIFNHNKAQKLSVVNNLDAARSRIANQSRLPS